MRFFYLILLTSASLSAQLNRDVQSQIKLKNYRYLDSINVYSKDYPTQLIEGSGSITDRDRRNIGSIGFSTAITKDKNDKVIRILKSESQHYQKSLGKPQKSIINEITIYFNDAQQPDLATYISKTYISGALVTSKNNLFDLQKNHDDDADFRPVKTVWDETKSYVK